MKTNVASKPAIDNATQGSSADELKGAAKAVSLTVQQEYEAIVAARQAYFKALAETGSLGLVELAKAVGRSVTSKVGRPALAPWSSFVLACSQQKVDHKKFDFLCRSALEAVGTDAETPMSKADIDAARGKFIKQSAKGEVGGSSAKLKMNTPAAWAIALGE